LGLQTQRWKTATITTIFAILFKLIHHKGPRAHEDELNKALDADKHTV